MPDAITRLTDAIIPSKFVPYMIERTATKSDVYVSGIVQRAPEWDEKANGSGVTFNMPFWTDLTGASQLLSDQTDVTTSKIDGTKRDLCVKQGRQNAWSANDLVKLLIDGDPMAAIAELVAAYWARDRQTMLFSSLKGIFAAASMAGSIHDISTGVQGDVDDGNVLNGVTFIDALQKLGDAKSKLRAIAMHSMTEASLLKNDLIDFIPDSEGKATIPVFQGRRVIVDDGCPVTVHGDGANIYTSYLFGEGAFAEGNADLNSRPVEAGFGTYAVELARLPKVGDSILINRNEFILHARGVKWTDSARAATFPTNAELETGANWERVFEQKNVRLVQIVHNNL